MRNFIIATLLVLCGCLIGALPAHAQPMFSHTTSLELTVVRAEVVVVGTIVDFKADTLIATLAVEETIKGMPRERYSAYLPQTEKVLARWKMAGSRLFVAVHATETRILDLTDGELEVMTADFSVLRKAPDALRIARDTVRRFGDKQVDAFQWRVPYEAAKDTQWGGRNLSLSVPVDDRLEKYAIECVQSKDYPRREEGARALRYFKSDANIGRLKPLLNDPSFTTLQHAEHNEGIEIRNYDVRQAALGTLQSWGVKVNVPPIRVKTFRTEIEYLSIGQLPDDLAAKLRDFKKLRELNWYSGVTDAMMKNAAGLTQLESFRLNGHSNKDVSDAGIKELKTLTNLTTLELRCPKMTDDSLKELAGLKKLTTLDLTYTNVNGSGLKNMACLPNLETLHLHMTKMNDAGMKALAPCSSLKTIYLASTRVTDAGMKELVPCQNLTSLYLGYTKVTDAGLKELAPLRNLTTIEIYPHTVTDNTLRVLREIDLLHALIVARGKHNTRPSSPAEVVEVELGRVDSTQVTDAGLKEIAAFKNLETLYLPDQITDAGVKELLQFKKLAHLFMTGDRLTKPGFDDLAKIKGLHTLGMSATDVRLRNLREAGLLHKLSYAYGKDGARPKSVDDVVDVNMRYSAISDAAIAEVSVFKNLVSLNVEHTAVGNEGLKHLARFPKLRSLDLRETGVTDAGLKHLETLTELREVRLENTNVSDAAVFALRKVLPKCRITVK